MYKLSFVDPCKIPIQAQKGNPEEFPQRQIKPHQQHNKQKLKTVVTLQRRSHCIWISSIEKRHVPWLIWNTNIVLGKVIHRQNCKKRFPML